MNPIGIFPISDKQTHLSSLIFVGELNIHFPLFLSTSKELVILLFFGIPNIVHFWSQNHDTSPVKKSNLTQPQKNTIVSHMDLGTTHFICVQARV